MPDRPRHIIGTSPPKREDTVLLRGQGRFTDDIALENPAYVTFTRAPMGPGKVMLDVAAAANCPGVLGVHTGADVAHLGELPVNPVLPILRQPGFPVLAPGHVSAAGQAVTAVVAQTPFQSLDAAEAVVVDIEETQFTPDCVAHKRWQGGERPAESAVSVSCEIQHPRLAPAPMEPRAIAVAYDAASDCATVWLSTQTPHRARADLAAILRIDPARLRVIAQHVGGAFGMKASLYPEEVFTVWAAFHHKRSVKWTATRSEDFLSASHGRGLTSKGTLLLDAEGRFLSLEATIEAPLGAWLPNSALVPARNAGYILPSGYRVPHVDIESRAMTTATAAMGIYRGAGRPEANMLMERLIDKAARQMGLDPLDLRHRNLLKPTDLPHQTATGNELDSGDYASALTLMREKGGYDAALVDRDHRRANGELVGVGVGFYIEPSGEGYETARVALDVHGRVQVWSGSSSQGHARETAYAQIAAEALNTPMTNISVTMGDTQNCPPGIGALASRSTAIGGSAVLLACEELRERRDAGEALPMTADVRYENKGQAWGHGAYQVVLSIDRDTGKPTIEQITCVDDCGRIINPALVNGQITGGIAQGIGEALMEAIHYDSDGQLLSGSLMDYALPRAGDIIMPDIHGAESPSPMNALGAKGVGEAGTIGAPPAILNAAIDALSPLGITDLTMPLTSHALWQAIQQVQKGNPV